MSRKIIGILPNYYVHVLDLNTNITTVEIGPQNLVLQDNHSLEAGPLPFVTIPPGHYCRVEHPIDINKPIVDGKLYELRFGHREIRLHGDPFPLFPGERLPESGSATDYSRAIKRLPTIKADHGIHLSALVDMEETDTAPARKAGDEWQLRGPLTYLPKPEEQVVKMVSPIIITPGHAVRLRARQAFTDAKGIYRCTGEEWLVRDIGAYLPDVYEEVVEEVDAYTLTPNNALHIRANCNFTDQFGRGRRIGEEWLVKYDDTESYIPDVTEEVVNEVQLTVLSHHQYCVVVNPLGDDGRPRLGCRELRKGPKTFFLHPGEKFERGIQDAIILESDEALLVTAQEEFDDITEDGSKVHRTPGDRWMIHGPTDYIPRTEIGNIQRRKATPLNENEGIYVRNVQSGQVRAILGPQSYLLQAAEELYEKELTPLAEEILKEGGGVGDASIRKIAYFDGAKDPSLFKGNKRDKTRVVTYRCPSNCAVQVYNYIEKTARVVFGPDLVVLDPHENFNVLSLSAGKPKKENALKTICLMLGPDFISDHITVEASDHARLKIAVSMNNEFRVERGNPESEAMLFSVPDFIGFACREVASKVRGKVASIPFEQFHKHSADIITAAVFGKNADGEVNKEVIFTANNLVITNIYIQSIEPIDHHMRDSLSKSVQMAIEISTKSIERSAQHEAQRTEQKAKGELERQKLQNEKEAEEARKELLELQAVAAAVESSGQAKAEAQAQAERLLIEGQSAIELAKLKAEATRIEMEAELTCQTKMQEAEVQFLREQNELQIKRAKDLSKIEVSYTLFTLPFRTVLEFGFGEE
ncbi:PREDICTED: major vault protein-like isoform X1 [Amphimedon queenslandica]|uniref:Major vault protein n=3 Tax=Amphimedon queenslandica TaxID=400682 RepID=A0A1X7VEZ8_AMPQE|nr:PREDICTED: major vault protein-like isoform X1 [Amphimedon queenslandica]|eukprot:XP_019849373.1 PREDICTED: major vault protein-like isoform X1 [Amphimedon queenslandica]